MTLIQVCTNIYLITSDVSVPPSSFVASSFKFLLFAFTTILMLRHRKCGVATSSALTVFWLVFTICGIILQQSTILNYFKLEKKPSSEIIFIVNMMYSPLVYVQFFLANFVDKRNFDSLEDNKVIEDVSLFSYATFSWFVRYLIESRRKLLTVVDLKYISARLVAQRTYSDFLKRWNINNEPKSLKSRSLGVSLVISFWPWLSAALLCNFLFALASLIPPLILDRLINFVDHDHYAWRGMLYVTVIFIVDAFAKIFNNFGVYFFFSAGAQMKSALMNAVYRKNFLLSPAARKDFSSGSISNLLSVDIQRLSYFTFYCSELIICPIRIVIILVLMWQYIGIATLSGLAVIIFFLPVGYFVSKYSEKFTEEQMKVKDLRLKFMNEILSGIKILKLYAWEVAFTAKVSDARRKELNLILYSKLCAVVNTFVFYCAPILISVSSFATYLYMDRKNVLDPTKAFVTITLMDQLKYAMFVLPESVSELIQSSIALGRLRTFFAAENAESDVIGNNPDKGDILTIRKASFKWAGEEDCTLHDIELHIPKGKLVAVIGPVGSGKSSLLSAMLGDINRIKGSIDIKGSLAYVPQQAWILNRTVKENILMMKNMSEEKYNRVLDLCCLRPDLEILPAGDNTEIGEKGVNLSGGQKQRVSLARAVYQDKDIYLLDDTLSAVDVHVRKALFDDIIGNGGLLKKKTRILVTHEVSILHKMDIIVSMKDGRIDEIGSYQDLLNQNGSFMELIQEHTSQKNLEENTDENKKMLCRYISTDSASSKTSDDGAKDQVDPTADKHASEKTYRLIEDEKMEVGKVHRLVYWTYIKSMSCPLWLCTVLGYLAYVISETYGNIWLAKWTTETALIGTHGIESTAYRLEVYSLLGLGQVVFVIIGSVALVFGIITAAGQFHNKMLNSLLKSPMSFFDSTPMGRITNRFSSDLDIIDTELYGHIEGVINCIFFIFASFYIIGRNAPLFLTSLLPLCIIYYIFLKLHLNAYRQIRRLESTTKSPIYSQLLESIQGISSIGAYKVQKEFVESFEKKLNNHMVCFCLTIGSNRWFNFWLGFLGSIIVFISAFLAVDNRHSLTPADVGLMITYTLNVTDAIKWFVRMSCILEDKSISVERVDEYCKLASEAAWDTSLDCQNNAWPPIGQISFNNYSTKYREDLDLVIKNINLSINGSEKVGIIGRTGAGKSSITMALFRIIEPVTGSIFIDNIDISKLGLQKLRSKLTIIPQDPVLFTGTLRSNLDPNNEYSDDAVWQSLERSHLKSFVTTLDDGLGHNIEENGGNLSAGQKQLVCLARALLKNTKILVLDEATASVDIDTDNLIQNTIRTAFARNTVITIAHRLNTVLDYDKIVVMENGTILEVGNPSTLLQDTGTRFYEMCEEAGLT
ncbi:multidrug resistance-associated protein 1-like [Parasteatoda tepidariorum]|uniref:multidrug resistance-associated protein 1-like n=1 Tax=Parasteatoda tepidariorum TaxID=114398 RepID=UPI001C7269BB|nr:multidrug resistance-associated protein 1-like [Parasteatoda tepidariorum]